MYYLKKNQLKIILKLLENSRISYSALSRELKLSKETIKNNIEKLLNDGIIRDFQLKINYNLLGFKEINLFLRLKNITKNKNEEIKKFLINYSNTTWLGQSFGKYDFKVAILYKDESEIPKIIQNISSKYSNYIENLDYIIILKKEKFHSKNLLLDQEYDEIKQYVLKKIDRKNKIIKKINLDNIDKQLLYDFSLNPKGQYVNFANKFSLSAEAIKHRIKQLEKNNIIDSYSIVIDGSLLSKQWALLLLKISPDKIDDFKELIEKKQYVSTYFETLGLWNICLNFFAPNMKELYSNLSNIRSTFSEDIKDFEILLFLDFYKYPKAPTCILK
jgi:Lrp/AsnC family leucine-responsive transcriptional regulator